MNKSSCKTCINLITSPICEECCRYYTDKLEVKKISGKEAQDCLKEINNYLRKLIGSGYYGSEEVRILRHYISQQENR